jgi:hypothetical protein
LGKNVNFLNTFPGDLVEFFLQKEIFKRYKKEGKGRLFLKKYPKLSLWRPKFPFPIGLQIRKKREEKKEIFLKEK